MYYEQSEKKELEYRVIVVNKATETSYTGGRVTVLSGKLYNNLLCG